MSKESSNKDEGTSNEQSKRGEVLENMTEARNCTRRQRKHVAKMKSQGRALVTPAMTNGPFSYRKGTIETVSRLNRCVAEQMGMNKSKRVEWSDAWCRRELTLS